LKKVPDSSVIPVAGKSVEKPNGPNPIKRETLKNLSSTPFKVQNEKSLEETKPKGPKLEGRV